MLFLYSNDYQKVYTFWFKTFWYKTLRNALGRTFFYLAFISLNQSVAQRGTSFRRLFLLRMFFERMQKLQKKEVIYCSNAFIFILNSIIDSVNCSLGTMSEHCMFCSFINTKTYFSPTAAKLAQSCCPRLLPRDFV